MLLDEANGLSADAAGIPQVLVVDDEADVAEEVAAGLRSLGFAARFDTSPQRTLATLRADAGITVLVSDIRMPGCSGLELAQAALSGRTDADALSVVLITANANISDALQALRQGVADFVRKPFRRDEIGKAVLRAHEQATVRRRLARKRFALRARIAEMVNENAALSSRLSSMGVPEVEIQKTLADALGSRTQFLAFVSHELRTPLVPILGFSELLASGAVTDIAQMREYAGLIHEAGQNQMRLIDSILMLTRLHAGELAPTRRISTRFDHRGRHRRISGRRESGLVVIGPRAVPAAGHGGPKAGHTGLGPSALEAMHHATPATPIEIAVQATDRDVSIVVSDLPGIPRHMESLPDTLRPGRDVVRQVAQGLGLGLAIAARLIAIQGGRLTSGPRGRRHRRPHWSSAPALSAGRQFRRRHTTGSRGASDQAPPSL